MPLQMRDPVQGNTSSVASGLYHERDRGPYEALRPGDGQENQTRMLQKIKESDHGP